MKSHLDVRSRSDGLDRCCRAAGFPGTWMFDWRRWRYQFIKVKRLLAESGQHAEIWITKTGFSTWKRTEHQQLRVFIDALDAPVSRLYWYAARDLHPDLPAQDGFSCG